MPHREVKERLENLKRELQKTPQETGPFEEVLEQAREGMERYTPESVEDLIHTLQQEAREFEVEHPQITALINQVMTSLSNIGI